MLHLLAAALWARGASAGTATATFNAANSGLDGTVTLTGGVLTLDLNVNGVDAAALTAASLPADCLTGGLKYHLHEKWEAADNTDRIGSDAANCGGDNTGGHFDPYAACAGPSGNPACDAECLNLTGSAYSCDFANNLYSCEVGDWSGKYGNFEWDGTSGTNAMAPSYSSFYEVTSGDVTGMSIVFHCGSNGARALCAPFIIDGADEDNSNGQTATATTAYASFGAGQTASFASSGAVSMTFNALAEAASCTGGMVKPWIYEQWDDAMNTVLAGSACTEAIVGKVWDATNACPYNSNNANCDPVSGNLCNNTDYAYACDLADRYKCSPADVLGSLASTPAIPSLPVSGGTATGTQFNMYPVADLIGKALVLTCTSDMYVPVACAKLVATDPDAVPADDSTAAPAPPSDDSAAPAVSLLAVAVAAGLGAMAQ